MNLKDFVLENQKVIDLVKDRVAGDSRVDMYYGTLDYATARFHTIILKLSQDKIKEQEHLPDVVECFETIQAFYKNVQRYRFWPRITRPFIKMILHGIGTRRIPKIKRLLEKLDN
jgi:hypothetical protein|tara:strand:- start:154 stop:498 length:345 start_codon:yes stop_codon:yes gene_type:complete